MSNFLSLTCNKNIDLRLLKHKLRESKKLGDKIHDLTNFEEENIIFENKGKVVILYLNYTNFLKYKNKQPIRLNEWCNSYFQIFDIVHSKKQSPKDKDEYLKWRCIEGCSKTFTFFFNFYIFLTKKMNLVQLKIKKSVCIFIVN